MHSGTGRSRGATSGSSSATRPAVWREFVSTRQAPRSAAARVPVAAAASSVPWTKIALRGRPQRAGEAHEIEEDQVVAAAAALAPELEREARLAPPGEALHAAKRRR